MRERERQRHRQREKQAPCREPDVGLDPRTPGSCPGLKAGAKPLSHPGIPIFFFFKDFIYLFMRDAQRETETQAEREAGSMQGAQCGTRSRVFRITPQAAGGTKPLCHRGCPPAPDSCCAVHTPISVPELTLSPKRWLLITCQLLSSLSC